MHLLASLPPAAGWHFFLALLPPAFGRLSALVKSCQSRFQIVFRSSFEIVTSGICCQLCNVTFWGQCVRGDRFMISRVCRFLRACCLLACLLACLVTLEQQRTLTKGNNHHVYHHMHISVCPTLLLIMYVSLCVYSCFHIQTNTYMQLYMCIQLYYIYSVHVVPVAPHIISHNLFSRSPITLLIAYRLPPIAYHLSPIAHCLLPIVFWLLLIAYP